MMPLWLYVVKKKKEKRRLLIERMMNRAVKIKIEQIMIVVVIRHIYFDECKLRMRLVDLN